MDNYGKEDQVLAVYEYRCKVCGQEFEVTRPMSESSAPAKCPKCGADAQRLVSGFSSTEGYGVKGTRKAPFRGNPPES